MYYWWKLPKNDVRKKDCTGTTQNPSTMETLGARFSSFTTQNPKSSFGNEWSQTANPAISKQLLWTYILTSGGKSEFFTGTLVKQAHYSQIRKRRKTKKKTMKNQGPQPGTEEDFRQAPRKIHLRRLKISSNNSWHYSFFFFRDNLP
jgi:hypothetical protein